VTTNENIQTLDDRQNSGDERRRKVFLWISELGLVAGCVAVFFSFLVVLIGVYFPQGSTLVGERISESFAALHDTDGIDLQIDSDAPADDLFAAKIIRMQRRVHRRGARSLAWDDAQLGDTFVQDDAVQTYARSTALLEVGNTSYLTVHENSLIVFNHQEADPYLGGQQTVMLMIEGELSGTLSGDDTKGTQFAINLPNSDVTLVAENPGDEIDFQITVNDDQSTTVNLHAGIANIVGRDGKLRTINAKESVTIDPAGTTFRVTEVPPAPSRIGPANNSVVVYRNVPQKIRFNWASVELADRYHVVIARDPEFSDRIVDDDVLGTEFTHGALGSGTYYWHVRSRVEWAQSDKSDTHQFRVIQDLEAPMLELNPPAEAVVAGAWRLTGRTEPDASVSVDGVPISHEAGRIDQEIALRRGVNIITVKAMDGVGNLNYESLAISAK
jgi:hypothetical protein